MGPGRIGADAGRDLFQDFDATGRENRRGGRKRCRIDQIVDDERLVVAGLDDLLGSDTEKREGILVMRAHAPLAGGHDEAELPQVEMILDQREARQALDQPTAVAIVQGLFQENGRATAKAPVDRETRLVLDQGPPRVARKGAEARDSRRPFQRLGDGAALGGRDDPRRDRGAGKARDAGGGRRDLDGRQAAIGLRSLDPAWFQAVGPAIARREQDRGAIGEGADDDPVAPARPVAERQDLAAEAQAEFLRARRESRDRAFEIGLGARRRRNGRRWTRGLVVDARREACLPVRRVGAAERR